MIQPFFRNWMNTGEERHDFLGEGESGNPERGQLQDNIRPGVELLKPSMLPCRSQTGLWSALDNPRRVGI